MYCFTFSMQYSFLTSYEITGFLNAKLYVCIFVFFQHCYAVMCSAGLLGAVLSRQVHQLKQGTHMGCGVPTLFNITDITNSRAEPHFKATRWVLGLLLKFNTANWLASPFKYKAFGKYNTSITKHSRVWVYKIKITIFFYWTKRKKQETIQVKARSEKVFF